MNVYLGLRDDWFFLENPAVLDAIEALQDMSDGTFYPTEYGPESLADIACPDLWGYLIPQAETEPFEHLFVACEDKQIAKLYESRFTYAQWGTDAEGEAKVSFLPAPVSKEEPLAGTIGKKATWARFWTWGPDPEGDIDIRCDLTTGRCEAEYISAKSNLPTARFRVAAAKLAPYTTISEDARYGEREMDPWMIYDGPYWEYILGTDGTVLLRGTRRSSAGKGKEPILSLLRSIRRSANRETRRLWGFAI